LIIGTILWRRLDVPGQESARLSKVDSRWQLAGTAVFAHEQQPCGLDYRIDCDSTWRTTNAHIAGWVGQTAIEIEIVVDERQHWWLNGKECPGVAGCIDVDLNFSPSTNLLPIRRLALAVGEEAELRAAWLRFPSFTLEPLPQRYHRVNTSRYHYESNGGRFVAELQVNDAGFVIDYPNGWRAEPSATGG
jgi:uncharacterized protein